jgi:lactate permease
LSAIWNQKYLLFGQGLGVSALIASLPILLLLFLLAVKRRPAWQAGLSGLGATLLLSIGAYGMSLKHTVSSAGFGAAFGIFPITWIVFWAIVLYRITLESGKFEIIKSSVQSITGDSRLQMLLIAFAFGAFLEGGAGFGTPVAVAAAMMTGLGFSPLAASAICLLANTAPVAFGAIGIPVITLAGITGLPLAKLSADVGRVCAPVSFIIPTYLIIAATGWGALQEIWPALLVCGGTFAGLQFAISNYIGAPLTDIISSLGAMATLVILLRFWHPPAQEYGAHGHASSALKHLRHSTGGDHRALQTQGVATLTADLPAYPAAEIAMAWMPYVLLVVLVLAWGYKPVQGALNTVSRSFPWPGLHNEILRMPPVVTKASQYGAVFNLNWLSAAGTSCMFASLLSAAVLRIGFQRFFALLALVTRQLFLPTLTVASVLAMAFVMNYCGATGTLGLAFAATGVMFPFFSSLLGWLGVFLTGSDTSANALFGNLQVVTAQKLGFSPTLMAAANSAGGVMGKMISLQTIAVAAAATGLSVPDQAKLFRFALRHSLLLAAVVGLEVLIYVYAFHLK